MTLLTALFFGFFAMIVIFQLVPATIMFIGTMKGLFFHKAGVKQ
jgi:hypothetical protein